MDQVRIVYDGKEKRLGYTTKYAHGIFLVQENKIAIANCKELNIELAQATDPNQLVQKVSKFEKTGVLTTRILNQHCQYILKEYAEKDDVEDLVKAVPPQDQERIREAYNLTKMNTLGDLDFLGGALDNKN